MYGYEQYQVKHCPKGSYPSHTYALHVVELFEFKEQLWNVLEVLATTSKCRMVRMERTLPRMALNG